MLILRIDPSGEVVEWFMALVLKTTDIKSSKNLTKGSEPCHRRAFDCAAMDLSFSLER